MGKKVRIEIPLAAKEKLLEGKPLTFRLPAPKAAPCGCTQQAAITEVEIVLESKKAAKKVDLDSLLTEVFLSVIERLGKSDTNPSK